MKSLPWLLLTILALIWGSSFILMKYGLEAFTSNQVAALRMTIAWLVLLPMVFTHAKNANLKQNWKWFFLMGLLGNFIPAFLFTKAETGISSSLTGMLNSLTPVFAMILGATLFKASVKRINAIGIMIGFVGATVLFFAGKDDNNSEPLFGLYVVAATISYALSVNIIRRFLTGVNAITASIWAFTFNAPMAAVYLFTTDFTQRMSENPKAGNSLFYVSLLAIFGTALSVVLFNILVKRTNALFASSVTYLIPIVAIGWGVYEKETLNGLHFMGMGIILAGVYLVNRTTISPKDTNLK